MDYLLIYPRHPRPDPRRFDMDRVKDFGCGGGNLTAFEWVSELVNEGGLMCPPVLLHQLVPPKLFQCSRAILLIDLTRREGIPPPLRSFRLRKAFGVT
jgi:hypothetical protein